MQHRSAQEDLRHATAEAVAGAVKAYDVPKYCESLGLRSGESREAHSSKRLYVLARLPDDPAAVASIAEKVLARFKDWRLEEALGLYHEELSGRRLSDLTRRALLAEIRTHRAIGGPAGKLEIIEFLKRVWPLDQMPSTELFANAEGDFHQHTVLNDDWDLFTIFERLDLLGCSETRFIRFLEELVHPVVRDIEDQPSYAEALNKHLALDGMELRAVETLSGFPVYRVVPRRNGVQGQAKNIIFAANGPKPEIVLRDAINNDVEIVKNAEYCLIFDRPIPPTGLRWSDLIAWWVGIRGGDVQDKETWRLLYRRLEESLASAPEKLLFKAYYTKFMVQFDDNPPALLPQVYLHFDPLTIRERGGAPVLPRQRMDFLLLLSAHDRIVIEVDGKQHYADGDVASPRRYGELTAADRELKLAGYDVFRFGGAELSDKDGERVASEFFAELFAKRAPC